MTTRVAVREITEYSWRALVAAGYSAGEASVAAEAVTIAEVCFGTGLDAVAEEVSGPTTATKMPVELAESTEPVGGPRVLTDPAKRGLLHIVPLALGLVAAERPHAEPVFMPHCSWHPVVAGFLLAEAGEPYGATLDLAVMATLNSVEVPVARIGSRQLTMAASFSGAWQQPGLTVASGSQVLEWPDQVEVWSFEELGERRANAEREGLEIPNDRWRPVEAAAKTYLVPD